MLQQITIQTSNAERLRPLLESAIQRETKLLEYSIERTRQALAPYETRYKMNTDEFERKFNAREIEETLDLIDWWMEAQALRHLEAKLDFIREARLE
jgi:hypothetical protein